MIQRLADYEIPRRAHDWQENDCAHETEHERDDGQDEGDQSNRTCPLVHDLAAYVEHDTRSSGPCTSNRAAACLAPARRVAERGNRRAGQKECGGRAQLKDD